ncbi:uncharacterized protein [Physcomitrium patens]|uniref:uncharacterized protein n=1 Tax=Physcomitrium patens TaxID=3218 RepID=UPI003CCDAA2B
MEILTFLLLGLELAMSSRVGISWEACRNKMACILAKLSRSTAGDPPTLPFLWRNGGVGGCVAEGIVTRSKHVTVKPADEEASMHPPKLSWKTACFSDCCCGFTSFEDSCIFISSCTIQSSSSPSKRRWRSAIAITRASPLFREFSLLPQGSSPDDSGPPGLSMG